MQATTASQVAKRNGLKSLKEVSDITGQSSVTLINWYKNKRDLFEVVVIGCVALKQIKGYQSGD
tara:strand:+ start:43 stop:234 length:192 start_codon:yes stop_codon:yes gene_type:complete